MANTGLVQSTDFSSDLLLNKVMNGQYRANSGKTITLAGRINAVTLDGQATQYNVQAENARLGAIDADAVANSLTEIADIAKRAIQINKTMSGDDLAAAATGLKDELDAILKTENSNGDLLFGTDTVKHDLGQGSGEITISVDPTKGGIKALSDALTSMSTATPDDPSTTADESVPPTPAADGVLEGAFGNILAETTNAASKAALFQNRYSSLNDLTTSYASASNDQVVNAGGNSTSLLNNLLS